MAITISFVLNFTPLVVEANQNDVMQTAESGGKGAGGGGAIVGKVAKKTAAVAGVKKGAAAAAGFSTAGKAAKGGAKAFAGAAGGFKKVIHRIEQKQNIK